MGAEARIAQLEAMRASRIGADGLAIKGYVANVDMIDVELARLRRTGLDHTPPGKRNQVNPFRKATQQKPLFSKKAPPGPSIPTPPQAVAPQPNAPLARPVFRPQTSAK